MSDLRWLGPILMLALSGCPEDGQTDDDDDDDGVEIGCDWFAGDNCWKDVVDAAAACAAPDGETGTFDASFEVCTFSDGTEVRFAEPAPVTGSPNEGASYDYAWNFEILRSGSSCLTLDQTELNWDLETSLGTFLYDFDSLSANITCPGGEQVTISGFAMLECDLGDLPQYAWYAGSSLTFDVGGGADGTVQLFVCGT